MIPGVPLKDSEIQVAKDNSLPTPHSTFVFSFYEAPNPEAFFEAFQMWLEQTPRIETTLSVTQLTILLHQRQGLIVLDGLERVQEDGSRGTFGKLASPKLREFLSYLARGHAPELSVLVTSRFPLADLQATGSRFFHKIPIEEIDIETGVRLLQARGVRGNEVELEPIVENCGRHALTVDLAGGYIAEFGDGAPSTPLDFELDSEQLSQKLADEDDESRRNVLEQEYRFARLTERYRQAMLGFQKDGDNVGTETPEGDEAALALLERICLFRLGVDSKQFVSIFCGEQAVEGARSTHR